MRNLNFKKELNFVCCEKTKICGKKILMLELLNIAQTLLLNYMGAKTIKMKNFYEIIYLKTKKFYLEKYK